MQHCWVLIVHIFIIVAHNNSSMDMHVYITYIAHLSYGICHVTCQNFKSWFLLHIHIVYMYMYVLHAHVRKYIILCWNTPGCSAFGICSANHIRSKVLIITHNTIRSSNSFSIKLIKQCSTRMHSYN